MDRFEDLKKIGKENIVIRDARLPDYDQVSVLEEVEYRLHREARPDYFKDLEKSYTREEFEELLGLPCPIALAAVFDGRVL